ncbi:methyltransferase [Enterococcus phage EFC-1]|nr:methyltransferase [Enterococcus phage EFC1]
MSKLPFEKDLKEALSKPTLTQRETALTTLVEKLQEALVDSEYDRLTYERWCEENAEDVRGLRQDLEEASLEIESLESGIRHLEEQVYDLENELESSEETVEELTEEVDMLSERVEDLESIIESLED